jgi:restriction endonuclease S subunit
MRKQMSNSKTRNQIGLSKGLKEQVIAIAEIHDAIATYINRIDENIKNAEPVSEDLQAKNKAERDQAVRYLSQLKKRHDKLRSMLPLMRNRRSSEK